LCLSGRRSTTWATPPVMDKVLHVYDLAKLNQEDMSNLDTSKVSNEIKAVIKSLLTK
jgi:hypothetical protein